MSDDHNAFIAGEEWRSYVAWVQQTIAELDAEDIVVSKEARLRPAFGADVVRFDVYYAFKKLGIEHRVAIECKAVARGVEAADVREFAGRLSNVPGIVGVVASKYGFQSGCYEEAQRNGVLLLTSEAIPDLPQMVGKLVSAAILPTEDTIGDPFWTVMPADERGVLGNYHLISTQAGVFLPLFISRFQAERYRNARRITDCVVRGLTQRMLMTALRLSRFRPDDPSFDVAVVLELPEERAVIPFASEDAWQEFVRSGTPFPNNAA